MMLDLATVCWCASRVLPHFLVFRSIVCLVCSFGAFVWSAYGSASSLSPLSDAELGEVAAKAGFVIDQMTYGQSLEAVRVTLPADIELAASVESLELGSYERTGELEGSADISISNLSMGHIVSGKRWRNVEGLKVNEPRFRTPAGVLLNEGDMAPFYIRDPFIELVSDGNDDFVGFRLGAAGVYGSLSGDVHTISGNVSSSIFGSTAYFEAVEYHDLPFYKGVAGFVERESIVWGLRSPVNGVATLVDQSGNRDNIRASMVGIPNGEVLNFTDVGNLSRLVASLDEDIDAVGLDYLRDPFGSGLLTVRARDCLLNGGPNCVNLSALKTNFFGKPLFGSDAYFDPAVPVRLVTALDYWPLVPSYGPESFVPDVFIAFSKRPLEWVLESGEVSMLPSGYSFNIPAHAVHSSLFTVFAGQDRLRNEYIDRGLGMF